MVASCVPALSLLITGCASLSTAQPKPGTGIAEYRKLTRDAHQAVVAILQSLEALARPSTASPHPSLGAFEHALENLELTSFKTRSRAEAIIARGQAYFDEWKANLAGITNEASAQLETEHYERLLGHFEQIKEGSGAVRTEFRPFMTRLRESRSQVDRAATPAQREEWRSSIDALTTSGRRVLDSLEAVEKSLGDADTELRATLAARK